MVTYETRLFIIAVAAKNPIMPNEKPAVFFDHICLNIRQYAAKINIIPSMPKSSRRSINILSELIYTPKINLFTEHMLSIPLPKKISAAE